MVKITANDNKGLDDKNYLDLPNLISTLFVRFYSVFH